MEAGVGGLMGWDMQTRKRFYELSLQDVGEKHTTAWNERRMFARLEQVTLNRSSFDQQELTLRPSCLRDLGSPCSPFSHQSLFDTRDCNFDAAIQNTTQRSDSGHKHSPQHICHSPRLGLAAIGS